MAGPISSARARRRGGEKKRKSPCPPPPQRPRASAWPAISAPAHLLLLPTTLRAVAAGQEATHTAHHAGAATSDLPPRRNPAAAATGTPPTAGKAAAVSAGGPSDGPASPDADLLWTTHAGRITFERPAAGAPTVPTTMTLHGVAPM